MRGSRPTWQKNFPLNYRSSSSIRLCSTTAFAYCRLEKECEKAQEESCTRKKTGHISDVKMIPRRSIQKGRRQSSVLLQAIKPTLMPCVYK